MRHTTHGGGAPQSRGGISQKPVIPRAQECHEHLHLLIFPLTFHLDIPLTEDDELDIRFHGTAHDRKRAVEPSKAIFALKDTSFLQGKPDAMKNGKLGEHKLHRLGGANKKTEYWVYYSVLCLEPAESPAHEDNQGETAGETAAKAVKSKS